MRRVLLVMFICIIIFSIPVLAQTVGEVEESQGLPADTNMEADDGGRTEIPWGQMDDRQIALMIINRQIDYLMGQVEGNHERIAQLQADHEAKLGQVENTNRERLQEIEGKMAEKDNIIVQLQEENRQLERQILLYNNENAVYIKMLLSLLTGIPLGLILGVILRWWKHSQPVKRQINI
jgi:hypothetical protein